jgi:AcrR family transcriptional regulator
MSPRPYRLGQRQAATDKTRARIIEAARELLLAEEGVARFSMEAVARQADVARMTVYYQFGSKNGLLDALADDLAARGGMQGIAAVFHESEPLAALDTLVAIFARFWASDRLIMRRLRALAVLDPEMEQAILGRDEWRRNHCRVVLGRIHERYGRPPAESLDDAVALLTTLLSFETFDMLAGTTRSIEEVTPLVRQSVLAVLGLEGR